MKKIRCRRHRIFLCEKGMAAAAAIPFFQSLDSTGMNLVELYLLLTSGLNR